MRTMSSGCADGLIRKGRPTRALPRCDFPGQLAPPAA